MAAATTATEVPKPAFTVSRIVMFSEPLAMARDITELDELPVEAGVCVTDSTTRFTFCECMSDQVAEIVFGDDATTHDDKLKKLEEIEMDVDGSCDQCGWRMADWDGMPYGDYESESYKTDGGEVTVQPTCYVPLQADRFKVWIEKTTTMAQFLMGSRDHFRKYPKSLEVWDLCDKMVINVNQQLVESMGAEWKAHFDNLVKNTHSSKKRRV